jgi:phytoene desaturase
MTSYFKSVDGIGGGASGVSGGSRSALPTTGSKAPTAVVIGTGFGGLAAAIRLSVKGYSVQMLEKLDAPGGRAYVHKQDGFTFDAGPTIITLPHLSEELFTLCGRRMQDHVD